MKITSIRHDKDTGREMMTIYDADVLMEKMKTETRGGYVTGLRTVMPQLEGTDSTFAYIDKLPRIYPAVEYARTKDGGRRMKQYNGLVQLEVKKLAGLAEGETSGDAASSNVCRFLRFQWKECEDMGVFRLTGWKLAEARTGSCAVSCPCLSLGGELLSAVVPVSHCLERAFTDAKLPDDA